MVCTEQGPSGEYQRVAEAENRIKELVSEIESLRFENEKFAAEKESLKLCLQEVCFNSCSTCGLQLPNIQDCLLYGFISFPDENSD